MNKNRYKMYILYKLKRRILEDYKVKTKNEEKNVKKLILKIR